MALIEAVLMYRPQGYGTEMQIPLASTQDPGILRAVQERVLSEMEEIAGTWGAVDPGVAAIEDAEVKRVRQILRFLLPDEEHRPDLRLVEQDQDNGA